MDGIRARIGRAIQAVSHLQPLVMVSPYGTEWLDPGMGIAQVLMMAKACDPEFKDEEMLDVEMTEDGASIYVCQTASITVAPGRLCAYLARPVQESLAVPVGKDKWVTTRYLDRWVDENFTLYGVLIREGVNTFLIMVDSKEYMEDQVRSVLARPAEEQVLWAQKLAKFEPSPKRRRSIFPTEYHLRDRDELAEEKWAFTWDSKDLVKVIYG